MKNDFEILVLKEKELSNQDREKIAEIDRICFPEFQKLFSIFLPPAILDYLSLY